MARKYIQGIFKPSTPKKYRGNVDQIIYRSSWELTAMMRLDQDSSVLEWNSEETIVIYQSPIDKRAHRYFLDFWVKRKMPDGNIREFIIEIKPKMQTLPPKKPSKVNKSSTNRYLQECNTYIINQSKWEAAERYAKQHNQTFEILTEDHLKIGK